tara:strand:+ start:2540 stop:3247 length:708 start_codon:yes stop_codon:yes gene_type:complete
MKISIIIPVFNERKNIEELIFQIRKRLIKNSYEIIVVDDSSTDGSQKLLNSLRKKYKNLKVIFRNNEIRDLSRSCRDGFEKSKYKNILVMDGDLQHDPIYIPKMIRIYKKYNSDFVVGIRELKNKRIKGLSIFRQFLSISIITILEIVFKKKTDDPMSGFFLFKKVIYKKNKNKLFLKGFKILADLIFLNNTFRIDDIKIKFNYRKKGKSKLNLNITLIIIQFIIVRFFKNLFLK